MCFGLVFVLITVLTKVIIFNFEDSQSDMAYAGKLLYVSETLQGLSFTLVYPVSLEFTVAQSPVHIRGVMVGLWYTFWGIGSLFNTNTKFPFHCQSQYIYTNFCYYLTKSALVFNILIVFVILAKRYKYSVRENEVNIVQIVDDHYQRYLEQEEQYDRDRNND